MKKTFRENLSFYFELLLNAFWNENKTDWLYWLKRKLYWGASLHFLMYLQDFTNLTLNKIELAITILLIKIKP